MLSSVRKLALQRRFLAADGFGHFRARSVQLLRERFVPDGEDLHGQQRRLKADVLVTRQGEGLVQVATLEPVLLKLLDFDLEEKLKPLKEMANIPSITPEVPVFAVLNFREVPPEQF